MRFKRALQRYGRTPEPETPYQRAGQMWDERIGSARVQARNWRLMAFGGLFLTTGLSAALVWQSMQSRVVPYVVEVDALGEARAVAPVATDYRPTDPQVAWHLGRFISNIRSKSLDPVLMRESWLSAYDFASPRGAIFLGEHARSANAFADIGDKTVSVQVTSVVRASDIRIDNVPATDTAGFAGLADKVDVHTWQLLKGVALSTLLGVGSELSFGSNESDLVRAIRESAQQSGAQAGDQFVTKNLGIQPTIKVRPGWPLRIVVHKDIVLRPWLARR